MEICTILILIFLIIAVISAIKWRIATLALIWFCKDKFREPTETEIADCARSVIHKKIKLN